ncbi:pyridoxal phosphate-dependent aminotransferase [Hymenobacter sp. BT186]|uniref:Pyridoxal phosphate-dependent aminotransferase n=1 Tax=Hymenobacter telluris TaxID=2816474 RepID=A0A939EZY7_9BACT|nr:pyridoxal phosphate-dependent aminotransferase [Hymenobacter telluris]MBO0359630.1 pyridoxal phosphate-dependent aminotransferase [Hymenobacter telluris]MBW3375657.1 pyridoxal phosphate-dependent aminotransferase [Hymenobacter norwichensis]
MPTISLASGYGNFQLPTAALARVTALLASGKLPASPPEGLPELREALVARYQAQGALPGLSASQVVVTPGTKAALFAILRAVLRPGDEVLLPTPNWFGFWGLVEQAGGTVRELPLSAEDNYTLSAHTLATAITPRTRLLLFTNPNNPTGRIYTRAEVQALLDVTRQHPQLFVLSDEIYDGICFEAAAVPTLLSFPDPHSQHVVVNGFSKSLALLGWNIGYLVAPAPIAQACAAQQFTTAGAVAVPSQMAALAATENKPAITAALRQQLLPNRQLLFNFLATLPQALPQPPGGTYYAFPDLRAFLDPTLPLVPGSAQLVARLQAAGVEVVDGATCHAPGFVRLSYAVPTSELAQALERLDKALRPPVSL